LHPLGSQCLTCQGVASLECYRTFNVVRTIELQRSFESNLKSFWSSDKLRRTHWGPIVAANIRI